MAKDFMERFETLYLCDPSKASRCTKESCHINSGPCYLTPNPNYAEEKDGEKIIAISKEAQEKSFLNGVDLVNQIEIGTKLAIARFNGTIL